MNETLRTTKAKLWPRISGQGQRSEFRLRVFCLVGGYTEPEGTRKHFGAARRCLRRQKALVRWQSRDELQGQTPALSLL
jgi:hypothetical protein